MLEQMDQEINTDYTNILRGIREYFDNKENEGQHEVTNLFLVNLPAEV
jgi:hypothetical protein